MSITLPIEMAEKDLRSLLVKPDNPKHHPLYGTRFQSDLGF
jgi:hypothetical protein